MHEYANVSVSSYDPAALAAKLTEKSAEGWELVAIVPTGGDTTAFLRREAGAAAAAPVEAPAVAAAPSPEPAPAPAPAPSPEPAPAPAPAPSPVNEPAGWATAPEPTPASTSPATVIAGAEVSAATPPAAAPAASVPAASAAATPAGWYHDPSGRFELRYWDGSQWTEHVARGGQQYTDPPVA